MMARYNAYGDGQFKLLLISSARLPGGRRVARVEASSVRTCNVIQRRFFGPPDSQIWINSSLKLSMIWVRI